jgi:flagellar basal body-associated protein FliL
VRHQAVRPLCALLTIFVVVIVFGLAVGLAQATFFSSGPHAAENSEATPAVRLAAEVAQPES